MNTDQSSPSLPETNPARKPVYGLSQRVTALAFAVDRLPPGRYMIEVVKDEISAAGWKIEIVRIDVVQKMNLSNYVSE